MALYWTNYNNMKKHNIPLLVFMRTESAYPGGKAAGE